MSHPKIHLHLVESTCQALSEIFSESRYADQIIDRYFQAHRQWGSRDRKFFAETVYEGVRWWRKYWFLLGEEPSSDLEKLIRFWGVHYLLQHHTLPESALNKWPQLRQISHEALELKILSMPRAQAQSIPDWLDLYGEKNFGSRWDAILSALNTPAPVDLRVNTLKSSLVEVRKELEQDQVETLPIPATLSGLTLKVRKNLIQSRSFLAGHFEIQDRASQQVAPFLQVEPGHSVIDACAGGGGKSLHLAALMKNQGRILSLDIHERKLKELRSRARRNGAQLIETRWIESASVIQELQSSADRVLLDVPCSGLGVLRRNPDTKWKFRLEDLSQVQQVQADILKRYSLMTKPGGKLVYATCSFLPDENEIQVESFLKAHPGKWILEDQWRGDPDQESGDGFFAARLLRL